MAQKEKQIKTLFLVRHAKAEPQDTKKSDQDRRLVDKGIRHAEKMSAMLATFRFPPELIYSSSAARAKETAEVFAKALKLENALQVEGELYSSSAQAYLQRIQKTDDDTNAVMLVGHNPVLEDLLVMLTSRSPFHCKMPTCGIAIIHFHVTLWSEIRPATGILRSLFYPKLFLD